jgi:hypothetical protein
LGGGGTSTPEVNRVVSQMSVLVNAAEVLQRCNVLARLLVTKEEELLDQRMSCVSDS